ncbi:FeoA family protein [Lagierella sp. ICN-221743]
MNLLMAPLEKELEIIKVRDKFAEREDNDRHLSNLGFVEGAKIMVVSEQGGNLIVKVKGSRVAIGKDIAKKIIVG